MDVVQVRWTKNRQFVGWDSNKHGIVMDTPAEGTGEGTGWRPVELLLLGMAGCTGVDVVSILEKKRQEVTNLEVRVHPPFSLHVAIDGLPPDRRGRIPASWMWRSICANPSRNGRGARKRTRWISCPWRRM